MMEEEKLALRSDLKASGQTSRRAAEKSRAEEARRQMSAPLSIVLIWRRPNKRRTRSSTRSSSTSSPRLSFNQSSAKVQLWTS